MLLAIPFSIIAFCAVILGLWALEKKDATTANKICFLILVGMLAMIGVGELILRFMRP
jgi:heme A synthase